MRKKVKMWISIKRLLRKNNLITEFLVPQYRKIKNFYRNMYFSINDIFVTSKIPSPEKIYWIDPKEIIYHTNYKPHKYKDFEDRVFNMFHHRGKVMGDKWDLSPYRFIDLAVFQSFKARIEEKIKWSETPYYQNLLHDIKQGFSRFGCHTAAELIQRFKYLDLLIQKIIQNGYKLSSEVKSEGIGYNIRRKNSDEVVVNIGREGEYLFQNGRHRLSIAILLNIDKIPVQVLVRHKKWVNNRKLLLKIAKYSRGKLYQPALHLDLMDIPYVHDCIDRFEAIKKNLPFYKGTLLDVGANLYYFCHKFEELGFNCVGVETDLNHIKASKILKKVAGKSFKILAGDILDPVVSLQIGDKYDVVLLLNILHHFLKEEKSFNAMTNWLKNLKVKFIFFEPHLPSENQMKDAYINYNNTEFLDYIMKYTKKTKYIPIYKAKDDRTLFMLT